MNILYNEDLVNCLEKAVRESIESLKKEFNENFYYYAFIIDEGGVPYISAWSYEALERIGDEIDADDSESFEEELMEYKWSPCDSPYCAYKHEEFFKETDDMIRRKMDDLYFDKEFYVVINSMEEAMKRLDNLDFFCGDNYRHKIVISVEIMPPEYSNTERIKRLNPSEAIQEWLEYCSEEPE